MNTQRRGKNGKRREGKGDWLSNPLPTLSREDGISYLLRNRGDDPALSILRGITPLLRDRGNSFSIFP